METAQVAGVQSDPLSPQPEDASRPLPPEPRGQTEIDGCALTGKRLLHAGGCRCQRRARVSDRRLPEDPDEDVPDAREKDQNSEHSSGPEALYRYISILERQMDGSSRSDARGAGAKA